MNLYFVLIVYTTADRHIVYTLVTAVNVVLCEKNVICAINKYIQHTLHQVMDNVDVCVVRIAIQIGVRLQLPSCYRSSV